MSEVYKEPCPVAGCSRHVLSVTAGGELEVLPHRHLGAGPPRVDLRALVAKVRRARPEIFGADVPRK